VLPGTGTVVAWDSAKGLRRWSRVIGGPALGAPLLAGDRLYVGTGAPSPKRAVHGGALHALDAATGKPLWRKHTLRRLMSTAKRRIYLGGITARPSLSTDGVIYATDQAGFLHAVDGRNGRSRQRESIDRQATYTPAVDGRQAFFHRGGVLHYLGRQGRILGFLTRPPKPLGTGLGSPALTSARIYVAGDHALVAADYKSTRARWRYALPLQTAGARHSAPVVAGAGTTLETVYLVDAAGTLHAVDGATGKALWTRAVARPAANPNPLRAPTAAAPALLPHLLLVSTPQGEVLALTDAR
jgi:outer membrane protein assembly factor BamB